LATSLSLQGFIVEAGHTPGRFQPILLDRLDPREELVHDVPGSAPKLSTRPLRDAGA